MAKRSPDAMLDLSLGYVQECDRMVACSAEPTTYAEAMNVYDLAIAVMTPVVDYPITDGTSGRKITPARKLDVPVDHTGTATHIAHCKTADATLRYVTTCRPQPMEGGGTVEFPAHVIGIADPQ